MSTSDFNTELLPDVEVLTRLANQFFSAPAGAVALVPAGITSDFPTTPGHSPSGVTNLSQPQSSLPDPNGLITEERVPAVANRLPRSEAGVGISPSATQQSVVPPYAQNTSLAGLPQQANGVNSANTVNAVNPINPVNTTGAFALPFENEYEAELRDVLSSLRLPAASSPSSAIPSASSPQFYFLEQTRSTPPGLQNPGANGNPVTQQLSAGASKPALDVELIRRDFPILQERVNGRQLVWLDNAATTQKPFSVIERLKYFYEHENSNIHRAAHELAARATDAYEGARNKVRCFLNAQSVNEVVFVRGATEAINLVAQSWGRQHIQAGDEIIISWLEHHANIVPWHRLCAEKGAILRVIPVDDDGQILLDEYAKLLSPKTKLVAFTQVSNALGTITPAKRIVEMAHSAGAKVLVDGAQSVSHMRVDVQQLDPDFFVFSGHKIFGPTGIGVLYGKEELLDEMQPWQGGGNMIKDVTFEKIQYHPAPNRFEAGTGNIADAVGLGAALDYVCKIGIDVIDQYEHQLLVYATSLLKDIPGLRLIGTAPDKASVASFVLNGFKTEEVGAALNKEGIAVRSGHHCAQPILRRFGLEATVRPSLAFYNNRSDVDRLAAAVERIASGRAIPR